MRTGYVTLAACIVLLAIPAGTSASTLIIRNATGISLKVNDAGEALVSYTAGGKSANVVAWGAVNAKPSAPGTRQVDFKLDYAGGWGKYGKLDWWKTFKNTCGRYTGPPLAWYVTACTATDGSHWALQSWQRQLPNYGLKPNARQAVWELRLSHWTGELPVLTIGQDWAYRKFDHLFGTFTYNDVPVFGYKSTPAGVPLDTFGRNLYLDTYNSAYGRGWLRENSFLMHTDTGAFCYGFYKHGKRPPGNGSKYRATIIGPGVTPDIMWEGKTLGPYNAVRDRELAEEQRTLIPSDPLCKPV